MAGLQHSHGPGEVWNYGTLEVHLAEVHHLHLPITDDRPLIQRHDDDHRYFGYAFDPPAINWATEPGVDPIFRAAILWWHERTGGSGFDDVYTIEEFLAHIRPLIEASYKEAAGLT